MKYIIFIFILGTLLSSCGKDEDDLTFLQKMEKAKQEVDQEYVNKILNGEWGQHYMGCEYFFNFDSLISQFTYIAFCDKKTEVRFRTQDYFYIQNPRYPDVYLLCTFSNEGHGSGEGDADFCATMFKIEGDKVWHYLLHTERKTEELTSAYFDELMECCSWFENDKLTIGIFELLKNDYNFITSSIAKTNKITE